MLKRLFVFSLAFMAFSLGWWSLIEGGAFDLFGLVVCCLLALMTAWQYPQLLSGRWHPLAWLKLVGFFILQSWSGALDVAKRALHPNWQVEPTYILYPLALQGWRRQLWIVLIGLFPGTLSVDVQADTVEVHVLDKNLNVQPGLVQLEQYLARL